MTEPRLQGVPVLRRFLVGLCAAAAMTAVATTAALASGTLDFNHSWGGSGVVAGRHTENFCANNDIRAGDHRRIVWEERFRGEIRRYDGTVYCSHVGEVWHNTTGPGGDGISIACPANQRPEPGGAGFKSAPVDAPTQVHGGFGHNHDGFWNYKFHNWNSVHTAHIQMWAVCLDKRQPNLHGV